MDVRRPARCLLGPPHVYHQQPWPYWYPAPPPPAPVFRDKEKKDEDPWAQLDAQAAFLGPNLWGAPHDQDLKLEYADLEEFLNESEAHQQRPNGAPQPPPPQPQPQPVGSPGGPPPAGCPPVPLSSLPPPPPQPQPQPQARPPPLPQHQLQPQLPPQQQPCDLRDPKTRGNDPREPYRGGAEHGGRVAERPVKVKVEFQVSPTDLALATVPGTEFDPQTHQFSDEELKPQPMCKKSKKQVVPEERKDEKYWTRRERNNTAAKRSRDARRLKENQIVLRANFLEKENAALREAVEELTRKNNELSARVESCRCH